MHCDQPLATAKDSVKVFFLVNEQAASTGAHENLDAAGGTDGIQGFKIIDSRPNKKSKIGKTIKHMADQEQEHIETFEMLILNHRVRPTALLPVWNVAGYFLGAATAMMGEKAAMACTVAVEKVIGEHYHKQLSLLKGDHKKLKATIKKFAQDELEHHDIGIAHDAEKTPGYSILTKFIEMGCKTAIAISKKI